MTKTNNDLFKSIIRTVVPVIVGLAISWAARLGIEIDPGLATQVVDTVVVGAYYALIRSLEAKHPSAGWFLGLPAAPQYNVWTSRGGLGSGEE